MASPSHRGNDCNFSPTNAQGLFTDPDTGHILEGPNSNVAIITQDDVLVVPPFDDCLAGVTMQRLLELIPGVRAWVGWTPASASEQPE